MTATSGSVFTAAQFNTSVRDNLNQTAPALVTAAGQILVSTAANALIARTPASAIVATSESTASTSYVDLTTGGPAVTAVTGVGAIVMLYCNLFNTTSTGFAFMSYALSGATTSSGSDGIAIQSSFTTGVRCSSAIMTVGLTAGSNTFTAKYRASVAGSATFQDRRIAVIPL